MEAIPGYDNWKTASPPETDMPPERCEYCECNWEDAGGELLEFEGETMCRTCFENKTTICPQCKEQDFVDHIQADGRCDCCHRKGEKWLRDLQCEQEPQCSVSLP